MYNTHFNCHLCVASIFQLLWIILQWNRHTIFYLNARFQFFGHRLRSGSAGLRGNSMFKALKNCHAVCLSRHTILQPHKQFKSINFSTSSQALVSEAFFSFFFYLFVSLCFLFIVILVGMTGYFVQGRAQVHCTQLCWMNECMNGSPVSNVVLSHEFSLLHNFSLSLLWMGFGSCTRKLGSVRDQGRNWDLWHQGALTQEPLTLSVYSIPVTRNQWYLLLLHQGTAPTSTLKIKRR